MEHATTLRAGAAGAAVSWTSGIAIAILTKGQDLQVTQTVEPKDRLLSIVNGQADLLLAVMGLDTLFVIGYLAVFGALYACVPRDGRLVAALGLAFGLLAGVSDVIENVLYIVSATGSLHGNAVAPELPFHYYVSSLKWVAAFTSAGLTALVFPRRTVLERLALIVMITLPVGGALSIALPQLSPLRALFFVVGLPLFALLFVRRARPGSAGAQA